jgi:glycosyltransferase involved in cell wall biosynthesis
MTTFHEGGAYLKVAAIIPAYNEEQTIGNVLSVLVNNRNIEEIIVVSDGSVDETVRAASKYERVMVVDLLENRGKGGAVKAGLDQTDADIILVLDADLIGLTGAHIKSLLEPVTGGDALMSVGIFEKGRVATDFAQKVAPFLSGQRAVRRDLLENISDLDLTRFGIEIALHGYVEENEITTEIVQLQDLSHVMKEEKLGLWKGMSARAKMYWEIIRYVAKIDINDQ